jgi:hypothetical protein
MTIEPLHLDSDTQTDWTGAELDADAPKGFWKLQFQDAPTRKQKVFDWAFGVIVPLICVAADPIVFRSAGPNGPLFGAYRPFAYLLSIASILAMAAWLLWRSKLKWLAAPISGLFLFGGSISLLVGIILLPFSIIGILLYFIGLLGLTPLFSAVVFLRNGGRAYRASLMAIGDQAAWQAALLAGLLSFVVPYVVNIQIARAVNEIATGDVQTIQRETTKLKLVAPLLDLGSVSNRYHRFDDIEKQSPRANELANSYKQLSGLDIEDGPHEWD